VDINAVPLKETALSLERLKQIADEIKAVYRSFHDEDFLRSTIEAFPPLGLKARVAWTANTMQRLLPDDIHDATQILVTSLPATPADAGVDSDFGSYKYAPHSQMIAAHGCTTPALASSLPALRRLTQYFTAEDAIRYFINAFPNETLNALLEWTDDTDHRVRRLASEGTRPKLPWSPRITTPLKSAIPILDALATDHHRFVTNSVANHVNDISTIDPELALALLRKWKKTGRQSEREAVFIARRALRTLVKHGHKPAFEFLGHSADPHVTASPLRLNTVRLALGDRLHFEIDLTATTDERLVVDYVLTSPKAGTGHSTKIFKIKTLTVAAGDTAVVAKSHRMWPTATRPVRSGRHTVAIQVNGTRVAEASFDIVT